MTFLSYDSPVNSKTESVHFSQSKNLLSSNLNQCCEFGVDLLVEVFK